MRRPFRRGLGEVGGEPPDQGDPHTLLGRRCPQQDQVGGDPPPVQGPRLPGMRRPAADIRGRGGLDRQLHSLHPGQPDSRDGRPFRAGEVGVPEVQGRPAFRRPHPVGLCLHDTFRGVDVGIRASQR